MFVVCFIAVSFVLVFSFLLRHGMACVLFLVLAFVLSFLEMFLFFLTAAIGLVFYVKKVRWNYWKNLGVFQIPGSIPVDDLLMLRHITDIVVRISVLTS